MTLNTVIEKDTRKKETRNTKRHGNVKTERPRDKHRDGKREAKIDTKTETLKETERNLKRNDSQSRRQGLKKMKIG